MYPLKTIARRLKNAQNVPACVAVGAALAFIDMDRADIRATPITHEAGSHTLADRRSRRACAYRAGLVFIYNGRAAR